MDFFDIKLTIEGWNSTACLQSMISTVR